MNTAIYGKTILALKINKPAYIGICILEFSKVLMYEFHYDYIKNKYGNNSRLLFADTGSSMYEIKTENVLEDSSSNKEMFDFSNYSTKSKYFDNSKKLSLEKWKMKSEVLRLKNLLDSSLKYILVDNSEHKKKKRHE